ncbi:MAG: hypothetical protein IPM69_19530 [Ignavibacteria bacterium]|nr:hypothetical protein [Ignavibacteria bacterium]
MYRNHVHGRFFGVVDSIFSKGRISYFIQSMKELSIVFRSSARRVARISSQIEDIPCEMDILYPRIRHIAFALPARSTITTQVNLIKLLIYLPSLFRIDTRSASMMHIIV